MECCVEVWDTHSKKCWKTGMCLAKRHWNKKDTCLKTEKNSCMKVEVRQVQMMKKSPAIRAINHNNQITGKKKNGLSACCS